MLVTAGLLLVSVLYHPDGDGDGDVWGGGVRLNAESCRPEHIWSVDGRARENGCHAHHDLYIYNMLAYNIGGQRLVRVRAQNDKYLVDGIRIL